jgi:ABC-type methionine transport system ATPase subunit
LQQQPARRKHAATAAYDPRAKELKLMGAKIFKIVRDISSQQGITILLVEQIALLALEAASRADVMESGAITLRHFVAARCQRRKFAHNDLQQSRKTKQVRKTFSRPSSAGALGDPREGVGVWET